MKPLTKADNINAQEIFRAMDQFMVRLHEEGKCDLEDAMKALVAFEKVVQGRIVTIESK